MAENGMPNQNATRRKLSNPSPINFTEQVPDGQRAKTGQSITMNCKTEKRICTTTSAAALHAAMQVETACGSLGNK